MDLTVNKAGSTQEKPMSEIKLTEEQFIEIDKYLYSNDDIDNSRTLRLVLAKQKGWIVKDEIEQVIEEANEYYEYQYELAGQYFDKTVVIELRGKYMKAIELLQNKIKELEK
jgi:hypothetical protein